MSYIREEYKDSDALAKKKSDYGVLETKTPTLDPAYNQKVALSDDILNQLKNKKFSYDINGDALYHQYKNQYAQQGKLASQDTMAQAAAMTGGYGNSYAATAGNQAYQGYLTKLNDVIPELYQLAYGKFADEKNDLRALYDVYRGQAADIYSKHRDEKADWQNELARLSSDIASMQNHEYNVYSDTENARYNQYIDEQTEAWRQKEWDYTTTQNTKSEARELALSYIGAGIMPDAKILKTAGISSKDAQALVDKTNSLLVVNDGGDDEKYVYAGLDENGNKRWYKGDKEFTFDPAIDPNASGTSVSPTTSDEELKDGQQRSSQTTSSAPYSSATKKFLDSLTPKSQHDAVARKMYGSYSDYVEKMIEKAYNNGKGYLSDDDVKYLVRTLL